MKSITKILKGLLRTKTAVPTKVGSAWTSGEIKAFRVGGTVFLKFSGVRINALTQRTTIATLPEGYRPPAEVTGKPDGTIFIIVGTGGSIQIDPTNGGTFYSNLTYPADMLGGGYCIVSLLCVISSLVRRWSHEQEYSRTVKAPNKRQESRGNSNLSVGEIVGDNQLLTSCGRKNSIDFFGKKTERRLDHSRHKRLWQFLLCFVIQQHIQWVAEWNSRAGYSVQIIGATALERGCC